MDAAEFEALGLYDPKAPAAHERLEVLEWLVAQDIPVEQMVLAERQGHLHSVAGDLALRPGPWFTLEEIAARTGIPAERIAAVRLAAGLPPGAAGEREYTTEDADMLLAFSASEQGLYGTTAVTRFAHTLGDALARIAEAAVSLYLVTAEAPLMAANASELVRAQRNLAAIRSLDGLQVGLRGLMRAHLAIAIRRQRRARRLNSVDTLHFTVGFVDLVGFTTVSRRLATRALAELIERFEDTAHEVVTARDGRVVKLIGDEVMFVAVDASNACDIALTLLERFAGDPSVTPRGALAAGELLFRGGDYYGPVVNTASRAAELAVPGEVLVTGEVVREATSTALRFEPAGKRMLKGFDQPVQLLAAGRA